MSEAMFSSYTKYNTTHTHTHNITIKIMNRAYRLIPFLRGEQGTSDLSALHENLTVITKNSGLSPRSEFIFQTDV